MAIVPGASLKAGRSGPFSKPSKPSVTEPATATGGEGAGGASSPSSSSKRSREPSKQHATSSSISSSSSPSPAPSPAPAPASSSSFLTLGVRSWNEDVAGKKDGKYSNAESKIVVDAVKEYAAVKSVSVEELCRDGGRKGSLKAAWPSISNCLPGRTVQSIYRHGVRKLKGLRSGPWITAEVNILQSLVSKHGQKWSVLEKEMGRPAGACRDKFREILPGAQEGGKPAWTEKEEKALNDVMMARLNLEDKSPLTLTGEEKAENVQWAEVAKVVKTRNRVSCHLKWSYMQARRRKTFRQVDDEGEHPTVTPSGARSKREASEDLTFVQALVSTGAADESEVNWSSLSSKYPRAYLLWKTLRGDRKKQSPYSDMGFQETAQAVIANLQQQVAEKKNNNTVSAGAGAGSVEENEEERQEKLGGQAKKKDKSKKTKKETKKTRASQEGESEPKDEEEDNMAKMKKKRKIWGQVEESEGTEETHVGKKSKKTKTKDKSNKKKKRTREGQGEESEPKDREEEKKEEEKKMAKKKRKKQKEKGRGRGKESEEVGEGGKTTKKKKRRIERRRGESEATGEEERSKKKTKKVKKKREKGGERQEEESERGDEKKNESPSTKKGKKRRKEAVETPAIPC